MRNTHRFQPYTNAHTHPEINSFYGVYSFVLFLFFFLGIHTRRGASTLRQRSQFKHIKSDCGLCLQILPEESAVRFLKRDTDNYRSDNPWVVSQLLQCVYTIWHGWNNSTNKNRAKIPISTFLTCRLSQTTKITVSDRAWNGPRKPNTHSNTLIKKKKKKKIPTHQIFRMSFCIYWQLLGVFCNT